MKRQKVPKGGKSFLRGKSVRIALLSLFALIGLVGAWAAGITDKSITTPITEYVKVTFENKAVHFWNASEEEDASLGDGFGFTNCKIAEDTDPTTLKLESSTVVSFQTESQATLTLTMTEVGMQAKINGTTYTAGNDYKIVVELGSGTHTIQRPSGTQRVLSIEVAPKVADPIAPTPLPNREGKSFTMDSETFTEGTHSQPVLDWSGYFSLDVTPTNPIVKDAEGYKFPVTPGANGYIWMKVQAGGTMTVSYKRIGKNVLSSGDKVLGSNHHAINTTGAGLKAGDKVTVNVTVTGDEKYLVFKLQESDDQSVGNFSSGAALGTVQYPSSTTSIEYTLTQTDIDDLANNGNMMYMYGGAAITVTSVTIARDYRLYIGAYSKDWGNTNAMKDVSSGDAEGVYTQSIGAPSSGDTKDVYVAATPDVIITGLTYTNNGTYVPVLETITSHKLWQPSQQDFGAYGTTYAAGSSTIVNDYIQIDGPGNNNGGRSCTIPAEGATGAGEVWWSKAYDHVGGLRIKVSGAGYLIVKGWYNCTNESNRRLCFSAGEKMYYQGKNVFKNILTNEDVSQAEKDNPWDAVRIDTKGEGVTAPYTGFCNEKFRYSKNEEAVLYFFPDIEDFHLMELEWIPDPSDLNSWGYYDGDTWVNKGQTVRWAGTLGYVDGASDNSFQAGTVTYSINDARNYLRLNADGNHKITVSDNGFTFNDKSETGSGYIMFNAKTSGTIRVHATGTGEVSITTGTTLDDETYVWNTCNGTFDLTVPVYGNDESRKVFVAGTAGVTISYIEWTPGEVTASEEMLVPVETMTVWKKNNHFGGYSYTTAGRAITCNELNPGKSSADPENNVPANTLLIFNEDNRQTNFTRSSNISLQRAPHMKGVPGAPENSANSNVVALKVKGTGVIRVHASGTGPSGRSLNIARDYPTVNPDYSVFASQTAKNGVPEHNLIFPRHQYSSFHEIFAGIDQGADEVTTLYIYGEDHIEEIRWIPSGTEYTFDGRPTYYGDIEKYNLTKEGCLKITWPQSGIILNPKDGATNDESAGLYAASDYTFKVEVTDENYDNTELRVPDAYKVPVFTTSQDGRYNGIYDGMVHNIHDHRGNLDENGVVAKYSKTVEVITDDAGENWKPGIVYVVAGTFEGDRAETRRIEIAGPDQEINFDARVLRDLTAPMKTITLRKYKDGTGETASLTAYPYLQAEDVDRGTVFIKVDDPTISWSIVGQRTDVVTLGTATLGTDYSEAGNYNTDFSTLPITAAAGGETIVRAKTVKGHYIDCKVIVLDENSLWLDLVKPTDVNAVSVYETIKFKATGNIDENTKLPVVATIKGTDLKVTLSGELLDKYSRVYQDANGDWYVEYDIVGALKEAYPEQNIEHLEYDTDYTLEFLTPDQITSADSPLTLDRFKSWTDTGKTGEATGVVSNSVNKVGTTVEAGGVIFGCSNSTVPGCNYVDLSNDTQLKITFNSDESAPRLLFNRDNMEDSGNYIEINSSTNKDYLSKVDNGDGTTTWIIDIEKMKEVEGTDYVHLNAIKASWGDKPTTVTDIEVTNDHNDNDRLIWYDSEGAQTTDYTNATAQPDFVFHTVPNPANVAEELFIYNVSQRNITTTDGSANSTLVDDINKGQLLSENNYENSMGTTSWTCNHRSLITTEGLAVGTATDGSTCLQTPADGSKTGAFVITPEDANQTNAYIESIKSIEIDLNPETTGHKVVIYEGIVDEDNNITWVEVQTLYADEANAQSVVWTPSTPKRYVKVEFPEADTKVDQLKITYYSNNPKYTNYYQNFQDYDYDSFNEAIEEGIVIGNTGSNGTSGVKMNFRQDMQDRRHFNLRVEYKRVEYDPKDPETDYNRGASTGDILNATKNVLVIRDDKANPCVLQFAATDNKAKIAYIEFVYEVDDQRNGFTQPRMLYCTSDPRQNPATNVFNMTGWPLTDNAYDNEHDGDDANVNFGDKSNLRRLIYHPEAPTNYATFAMDNSEPGFLFIRGIIVRLENTATSNEYSLTGTSQDGKSALDVTAADLKTNGITFRKGSHTAVADQGLEDKDEALYYTLRRTSGRNNLSKEIVLAGTRADGGDTWVDRDDNTSNYSYYQHNKNYTLRMLNQNRIVIRQLQFRTQQNAVPKITFVDDNNNEMPNTYLYANDPLVGNRNNLGTIKITIQGDDVTTAANKMIVYTLDGTAPEVTFKADGRTIDHINGLYAAGNIEGDKQVLTIDNNTIARLLEENNNTFSVKALAISLTCDAASFINNNFSTDAGTTYGEPSMIERAEYTYVDEDTYYTTAVRDADDNLKTDLDLNKPGYTAEQKAYAKSYDRDADTEFSAGYKPQSPEGTGATNVTKNPAILTYGGYELWQEDKTSNKILTDNAKPGDFKHVMINNDFWTVKANDITPWRGISGAVAGDAYVVSNLLPYNEEAYWGGTEGVVGDGTFKSGDIKSVTAFDISSNTRNWQGEFSNYTFRKTPVTTDENHDNRSYTKLWQLPCYGNYFHFEPEANGMLTVYVKQEGVLDQENGKLDDVMVWNRPVFIYDEQGNTPDDIKATTVSKVSGDWLTMAHTVQAGAADVAIANRYINADGATALVNMCQEWIKDNTSLNGNIEYGNRAYKPQGVITIGQRTPTSEPVTENGTTYNYTYSDKMLSYRNQLLGNDYPYDDKRNGFIIIAEGYVKYQFPVKAGKTYFMFAQNGNLGMCSYTFEQENDYSTLQAVKGSDPLPITGTDTEMSDWIDRYKDKAADVYVNRAFTAGQWSSIVLPFSVNAHQLRELFGDGVRLSHFEYINDTKLKLLRHNHQTLVAGVPVFIYPTKDVKGVTFKNVTVEADKPVNVYCLDGAESKPYYCQGSYNKTNIENETYYINNEGKFAKRINGALSINGSRCWIVPFDANDTDQLAAPAYIGLGQAIGEGDSDNKATGIDYPEVDDDSLYTGYDTNNVYDASGRLVRQNTTNTQGLPAGIYIVNGEKKVVK